MNIAIIAKNSSIVPSSKTGTWAPGIVIWNEARVLTKKGINVRVYCAQGSNVSGEVVHFNMPSFNDAHADVSPEQKNIRRPFYNNVYNFRIIKHLKENPVDLIHLHDFRDYPFFKNADLNIPILVTIHGDFHLNFSQIPETIKQEMNDIPVIAIGDVEIPEGINKPIAIIPNILEIDRFKLIKNPEDRLLFTSRVVTGKGADTAIKVASLAKEKIGIYGEISGDDSWKKTIEDLLQQNENATYHGYLPHQEIEQGFNGKAFLFPLRDAEGFPTAVMESMVSGTPVIAFAKSGVKGMIKDGVNGFLVEPGNIDAMVEAVKKVNQIDRQRCREYTLEKYSEETIGKKLIETFKETIAKKHSHNKKHS